MSARAARGQRFSGALDLWGLGYVFLGVVLATLAAWPVYDSPRALVVGIVGGLVGMSVAVLARMLRWGALLAGVLSAVAYVVVAVPLAIPSALSSVPAFVGGLRDAVLGVVLGWKQILTLKPPLGEYQAVLIPFLVIVLFGAFLSALLVLAGRRLSTLSVIPVSAMSVFGIAFGDTGTSSPFTFLGFTLPAPREWVIGVAVFVVALVFLVGAARLRRAQALRIVAAHNITRRATPVWLGIRRHVLSGAIVVVALVAGLAIAPAAAGWSDRSVLRDEVEPMIVVQQQPSPLSGYRSWFTAERADETVVRIDGDPGDLERIRIATLDSYDGQDFHVAADDRFTRLPRAAAPGAGRIGLDITVGDAYRGIWVPAPSGLVQAPTFAGARADALADGFHVDAGGDTAITIAETAGGAAGLEPGDRYSVLVDAPGRSATLTEVQGGESLLDADAHPALAEWADMQEVPRTGAGYLELIERLRARGYLSHAILDDEAAADWIAGLKATEGYAFAPSYAGHSTARIEELFTSLVDQQRRAGADATPAMLVAAVGDDEQFATAAALLAQHWGLESRVVLGARLPAAEKVPGIPSCDTECVGANMTAWVEVRASEGEWVAVDVTPQFSQLPSLITEGEQLPEHPTVPEQPHSESLDPPQAQSDSRDGEAPSEPAASDAWAVAMLVARIVGVGLLALTLLLLPLIVLLVVKGLRGRTRRTAADPEVRLVGAWEELADLYVDNGIAMTGRGTRVQGARSVGRPAAERLARSVDDAVFAAHPPTDADADKAWSIVDAERVALRGEQTRWGGLRARLRLRSFMARIAPGRAASRTPVGSRHLALGTLAMAGARRQEEDA
ncbi:transglutaminase domain-containing protein [Microbacterium sp. LWH10-1.2]|uniref:transglutaminase domain-containing protein n=1 Tax=Microbacterium sp. LWH10-1.2 TaxID=3135255 RepID=UPI0031390AFF